MNSMMMDGLPVELPSCDAMPDGRLRTEYHLSLIVDLRNLDELAESPDPLALLPEARFVHANIFEDARVGITQERAARIEAARRLVEESGDPVDFMAALYPAMLLDAPGIAGYRQFFEALLACEDGAALWHCQIGRDPLRHGLAAR